MVVRLLALVAACIVAIPVSAQAAVSIDVAAVRATVENANPKSFGSGLDDLKDTLRKSHFDTFHAIKMVKVNVRYGEESETKLVERYTLFIEPERKDDQGRIRMKIRIEEESEDPDKEPRTALEATTSAAPGSRLVYDGFALKEGTLIIILSVPK